MFSWLFSFPYPSLRYNDYFKFVEIKISMIRFLLGFLIGIFFGGFLSMKTPAINFGVVKNLTQEAVQELSEEIVEEEVSKQIRELKNQQDEIDMRKDKINNKIKQLLEKF